MVLTKEAYIGPTLTGEIYALFVPIKVYTVFILTGEVNTGLDRS